MAEEANIDVKASTKKDIRNYLCKYCGISRSKKYLITSHIENHHKMEAEEEKDDEACEVEEESSSKHTCQECGFEFKKPAHLKQHMQSHSVLRLFECYVDDCASSYRRKDHLNRHLLSHKGERFKCPMENCKSEFSVHGNISRHVKKFHSNGDSHKGSSGDSDSVKDSTGNEDTGNGDSQPSECSTGQKLFKCPIENCKSEFSVQGNVGRHVKKFHSGKDRPGVGGSGKDRPGVGGSGKDNGTGNDDYQPSECSTGQKPHVCKEIGCGKAFMYASQLQKHQDSHVKLDSVEAFCSEPGCMKYFTNEECLKAHIRSCHQYINCEICGSKHLKKNIKRHLKTHDEDSSPGEFKCEVEGCSSTFSKASNLQKHMIAVHEDIRPYVCGFRDCGMRFAYKHVRNNHEKSGCHAYTCGDFIETDEVFTSRPRGGLKRKQVTAEMLIRKRVMPPRFDSEEHETC